MIRMQSTRKCDLELLTCLVECMHVQLDSDLHVDEIIETAVNKCAIMLQ